MPEMVVIKFRFSGLNIETGKKLKNHKETHYLYQDGFSIIGFLEKIKKVYFPDDLWQEKQVNLIFVAPYVNLQKPAQAP